MVGKEKRENIQKEIGWGMREMKVKRNREKEIGRRDLQKKQCVEAV